MIFDFYNKKKNTRNLIYTLNVVFCLICLFENGWDRAVLVRHHLNIRDFQLKKLQLTIKSLEKYNTYRN